METMDFVATENRKKVLTMAEYIERDALMLRIKEIHCAGCDSYNGLRCRACLVDDALDYIDSEPAADVAPVVHCKDCKHLMFSDCYGECGAARMGIVSPDDFCSYGERRERPCA